jgi:DNA polymerase I-like protein with 3'-5' exonuclease and polymerase domains
MTTQIVKRYFELAPTNQTAKHYITLYQNQVDKITWSYLYGLHKRWLQMGRLSSNNPNSSAEYPDSNRKRETNKKAFVARDENYTLRLADYPK